MINNIVCPECDNSWDQEGKFDTRCKECGCDCDDQNYCNYFLDLNSQDGD